MSDEGGVTTTDAVREAVTSEVTPWACKGALGTWMVLVGFRAQNRVTRTIKNRPIPTCKPRSSGVDMRHHLSFLGNGKAVGGQTPRSKPDPGNPAVRDCRGAYGNVGYGRC